MLDSDKFHIPLPYLCLIRWGAWVGLQTTAIFPEAVLKSNSSHVNVSFTQAKQIEKDECFIGTHIFSSLSIPSPRRGWKTQNLVRDRQEKSWWCQLKHARYLVEDKRSGNSREEARFQRMNRGNMEHKDGGQKNRNCDPGLFVYTHTIP